jgi:hypothetical protein
MTPGFGLGAFVMLAELSRRWADAGRPVVWTGFAQAPTDLGDVDHGLAESGITDRVLVVLEPPTAPREAQIAALDRGIAAAPDDALLIVLEETGFGSCIEERLPALSMRNGTTLVVAPLDGSAVAPAPTGTPYLASIAFDVERARRGQWPAIGHQDSWSKAVDAEGASLAAAARAAMDDEVLAIALHEHLCQPLLITDAVLDVPGEHTSLDELRAGVRAIVQP